MRLTRLLFLLSCWCCDYYSTLVWCEVSTGYYALGAQAACFCIYQSLQGIRLWRLYYWGAAARRFRRLKTGLLTAAQMCSSSPRASFPFSLCRDEKSKKAAGYIVDPPTLFKKKIMCWRFVLRCFEIVIPRFIWGKMRRIKSEFKQAKPSCHSCVKILYQAAATATRASVHA
jgi:hypothetical protein